MQNQKMDYFNSDGRNFLEFVIYEELNESKQDDDFIENFDEFLNEVHIKLPQINSFLFHKQVDGICFYKLMRNANFSDLKFQSKILVDKNMNITVFIRDLEVPEDIVGFRILQKWSQLQILLENFEEIQKIEEKTTQQLQKIIEQLNHIFKSNVIHLEFKNQILEAKEILEKLSRNLEENVDDLIEFENDENDIKVDIDTMQELASEGESYQSYQQPDNQFWCDLCGESFPEFTSIENHILEVHKTVEFQSEDALQSPIEVVKPKPYSCPKNKYPCPMDECSGIYSKKSALQNHLKNYHNSEIENLERFCLVCKIYFESQNLCIIHKREHFQFACDICMKKCKTKIALLRHQAMHKPDEVRPFKCDECGGSYKTNSHLKSHKRLIHSNERQHPCSICSLQFPDETRLKSHIKKVHTSTEDRPCICPDCSKCFKDLQQLRAHAFSVHQNDLIYCCEICGEKFRLLNELKIHRNQEHGFPIRRRKYMTQISASESFL